MLIERPYVRGSSVVGSRDEGGWHDHPVRIEGLHGVISVSAGSRHACALHEDGRVSCWGNGTFGEVSGGLVHKDVVRVPLDEPAIGVAAGSVHSCALGESGRVYCWGRNYGAEGPECGRFDSLDAVEPWRQPEPIPVANIAGAASIAAGAGRTCVLTDGRQLICWGLPFGSPSAMIQAEPVPPALALDDVIAVGLSGEDGCVVLASTEVRCWGRIAQRHISLASDLETPLLDLFEPPGPAFVPARGAAQTQTTD